MKPSEPVISTVRFAESRGPIEAIRRTVFIEEQQVPEELEWDGLDDEAVHLLAKVDDEPVATARLLTNGHIGRMAVLAAWRNRGIGMAMLAQLIKLARQQNMPQLFLNAQIDAVEFYRRAGFVPEGEIFMDAGIPHKRMVLDLTRID